MHRAIEHGTGNMFPLQGDYPVLYSLVQYLSCSPTFLFNFPLRSLRRIYSRIEFHYGRSFYSCRSTLRKTVNSCLPQSDIFLLRNNCPAQVFMRFYGTENVRTLKQPSQFYSTPPETLNNCILT